VIQCRPQDDDQALLSLRQRTRVVEPAGRSATSRERRAAQEVRTALLVETTQRPIALQLKPLHEKQQAHLSRAKVIVEVAATAVAAFFGRQGLVEKTLPADFVAFADVALVVRANFVDNNFNLSLHFVLDRLVEISHIICRDD